MSDEPVSIDRRRLLGLTASIAAAAATLPSWNTYAREKRSADSVALSPGSFTAMVDDIELYCEVRGTGPLMVLQNGIWLDTLTNSFAVPFMNALAQHYTVLTFDGRGQGRSTAGRGPTTYARFASDTVRLMDTLGVDKAHFIGHSDGGCIQLNLLLDFCDRVKSSTLIGTAYSHAAYEEPIKSLFSEWFSQAVQGVDLKLPELEGENSLKELRKSFEDDLEGLRKTYEEVSPHPQRFEEMRLQKKKCWATEPNISLRQLARIDRPVLVIDAGKDPFIPSEQFKILADTIPAAQRVYFADMTHDITPYFAEIAKAANEFTQEL